MHQALLPSDIWAGLADANAVKGTRHLTLNNGAAVERYTRTYTYDLAGNLQRTRHVGTTRQWTTDVWTSTASNRSLPAELPGGGATPNPETWFDLNGNTTNLPHLRSLLALEQVSASSRSFRIRPNDICPRIRERRHAAPA